ncbi:MAG: ABC transporter substrate-binding protein [Propionibacteriaceae bacterium]|nr:ABC transporter substrate-binding protein [Propionibacteriaceae bacterium]
MCAALVVLAFGLTTGCSGNTSNEQTLSVGFTASPDAMDPTTNSAVAIAEALVYNVYETLVKLDANGNIRPLLAKEWSVSADQLTYIFQLEPNAKFASGAAVDAAAVVASIKRISENPNTTPVNKSQMSVVATADVVDATTVKVVLQEPSNIWLYNMAGSMGIIIDPTADQEALATTPAGSGPYLMKEWRKGESITFTKNPNYWASPANFDTVTFKYYADPNAMVTAMLSGDLDIVSNLSAPQTLGQFSDTTKYQSVIGDTNGEIVMGFNHDNAALSDLRVRQAIIYGLDREALRDSVWAGIGTLIGSMVPPTDPWYQDLYDTYEYNPERAKALLAEAGYASGLTLRLRIPVLPYATGSAQFIVSQLGDVGITVVVDELEFPARWVSEVMTDGNYDLTIVSHIEPRDIYKWADPTYYWHYNNPEFQTLISEATKASAEAEVVLMQQAAQVLADDAAADFLWLLPSVKVAKVGLAGIPKNSIGWSFDLTAITRNA